MDLYERLASATGFDWDEGNVTKSVEKHGVSTAECEQVFFNAPLLAAADPGHSSQEPRFFALGQTDAGRHLFVAFTLRGTLIRPISTRDMSRRERAAYTKHQF
ncbi:MAG TPA: BrnT family toxin [Rhodothermales bacterium]|nr:BrnT family toxin [Rhodothermales bacterium]